MRGFKAIERGGFAGGIEAGKNAMAELTSKERKIEPMEALA